MSETLNHLLLSDGAELAGLLRRERFREFLTELEPAVALLGGKSVLSAEQQYALSDVARRFAEPGLRGMLAASLLTRSEAHGLEPQERGWTMTASMRLGDPDDLQPPRTLYRRIMECSRGCDAEHPLGAAEQWLVDTSHLSLGDLGPAWWRDEAGATQTDEWITYPFRIEAFSPHHPPGWYAEAVAFLTGRPLGRP